MPKRAKPFVRVKKWTGANGEEDGWSVIVNLNPDHEVAWFLLESTASKFTKSLNMAARKWWDACGKIKRGNEIETQCNEIEAKCRTRNTLKTP